MTVVRGHSDLICPCLSVYPSICLSGRHTLRYRFCVISSSYSLLWVILKLCRYIMDILKMCMWVLDGACLSVCPSVCPCIHHTLWNRVCGINSWNSFHSIFLKPCILVVDIMKMCMWIFDGARLNFDRITSF